VQNRFGEITIQEMTDSGVRTVRKMTYTCGHCSAVVVMNDGRTRERRHCLSCDSLICETNELCQVDCTPLHAMAKDHFEGAGKWGRLVPAIMQGAGTVEEARKLGIHV